MHWKQRRIIGYSAVAMLVALGAIGCTSDVEVWPQERLLGRGIPTFRPDDESRTPESLAVEEPAGALTLRKALALALARNPALAATSWSVRAAEARALQEGLPPNPEVRAQLSQFAGVGEYRGARYSEQSVRVSQIIELGGKAAKRRRAARLEAALCGWDYETKRLDVFTETTKAFLVVLAAQKRLAAAQELHDTAKHILSMVSKRVQGGAGTGLEIEEARIELGNSRIELDRAQHAMGSARGLLANHWNEKKPTFQKVTGDLDDLSPANLPTWEQVAAGIENNPDVSRWETEDLMRKAALEREKAKSIIDVRVLLGGKRIEDTRDHGFMVALEIPLPIFDRNQGSISEARLNCRKTPYEKRAATMLATAALHQAYQSLSVAQREAKLLKTEVLPAAQATCLALKEGGLTDLQLMKAQRTLFKARVRQIDALEVFHVSLADVERLTGQAIGDFTPPDRPNVAAEKKPHADAPEK
ncbi:MAG: TolC family protein [Planctomycetes bacterium]|nr:TolC family protein [Planctomycetota bacterium]